MLSRTALMRPPSAAALAAPQSFDHLAARYDRYAELVGAELRMWLRMHLPPRYTRALDAGCGTGIHTPLLADRANEVLAVDLSAPMLAHARTHHDRGNIQWERRDLHAVTPATDGLFDVVWCAYTLHHAPDLPAALAHLRTLVRPGGVLLLADVTDPDADQLDHDGHRRRADPTTLRTRAFRTYATDILYLRRPPAQATELLRLSLDPDWIAHQATDQLLTPAEWDTTITTALPGATTGQLTTTSTAHWHAPETGTRAR